MQAMAVAENIALIYHDIEYNQCGLIFHLWDATILTKYSFYYKLYLRFQVVFFIFDLKSALQ